MLGAEALVRKGKKATRITYMPPARVEAHGPTTCPTPDGHVVSGLTHIEFNSADLGPSRVVRFGRRTRPLVGWLLRYLHVDGARRPCLYRFLM